MSCCMHWMWSWLYRLERDFILPKLFKQFLKTVIQRDINPLVFFKGKTFSSLISFSSALELIQIVSVWLCCKRNLLGINQYHQVLSRWGSQAYYKDSIQCHVYPSPRWPGHLWTLRLKKRCSK